MSTISKMRASIDFRLDKAQARAEAFDAALASSKGQIDARIARHRQQAQQQLSKLAADLDAQTSLPAARKQALRSEVDNLDEQIGLAQSASRETLASVRRQIQEGIGKMETELDAALGEAETKAAELLQASTAAYARALDKLDAELEAAQHRFASTRSELDTAVKTGHQEIAQEIAKLKQRLAERKTHTGENLAHFERELGEGVERVAKAFKDLFA